MAIAAYTARPAAEQPVEGGVYLSFARIKAYGSSHQFQICRRDLNYCARVHTADVYIGFSIFFFHLLIRRKSPFLHLMSVGARFIAPYRHPFYAPDAPRA